MGHRVRSHRLGLALPLAAVLMALIAVVGAPVSSGAAATPITYALTGAFTIATTLDPAPIVLPPGSTFTATPDPSTGVFSDGKFTIPTIGNVQTGEAIITNPGPDTGRVDPVSGAVTITAQIQIAAIHDLAGTCTYGPFEIQPSSGNAGGSNFTSHPGRATVAQQGYTVPAGVGNEPDALFQPCGDNPAATTRTSVTLTLTEPGGTPTTTTPATTTVAAVPQAVTASPGFTG